MGLITWIIMGGLTGILASLIIRKTRKILTFECILAGIAGALTAGILTNVFFPPGGIHITFSWQSAISASFGAWLVIFSYWLGQPQRQKRTHH